MSFDLQEYRRNRAKQETRQETRQTEEEKFDLQDYRRRRNAESVGNQISSRVKGWMTETEGLVNSYNERYGSGANAYRSDASDWLTNVSDKTSALGAEADSIQSLLDNYADYLDADWVSQVSRLLNDNREVQNKILANSTKDSEFWSQFADEPAYKKWLSGWLDEEAKTDAETIALRKEIYQRNADRIAEIESKYSTTGWRDLDNAIDTFRINLRGGNAMEELAPIREEYDRLRAENRQYEREQAKLDSYFVPETEEFLRNAAYREYGNPTKQDIEAYAIASGNMEALIADGAYLLRDGWHDKDGNLIEINFDEKEPVVSDKLGFYLDNRNDTESVQSDYARTFMGELMFEGKNGSWEFLKDNEVNTYYNLLKTEGQEAAYKFLDAMKTTLNKRATQAMAEDISDAPVLEQIFYNAASVGASVFGGATAFVEDAVNMVQGKDVNPYSYAHRMMNFRDAVRQDTAADINAATGNAALPYVGTTFGDVYQALMSGADSLVGIGLGGSTYGVLMGMGAASSEAKELYEKGASMGQIAAGGLLAGAAEMVFEKVSIDNFIKMGDAKTKIGIIVNALKQGGIEASEEMLTEIANVLSDAIVMGTQSDLQGYVNQYISQGYSESQAVVKALFNDVASDVINAGIGGLISGGGMGSLGSVGSYANYQSKVKKHGQSIISGGGVDTLKDLALEMADVKDTSKAREIGRLARKVDSKASAKNVGKLSAAIEESIGKQDAADLQKALVDKGMSKSEARSIADALTSGEKLSAEMENKVNSSREVAEAFDELRGVIGQRKFNLMAARMGVDTKGTNAVSSGELSLRNKVDVSKKVAEGGKAVKSSTGEAVVLDKSNAIAKVATVNGERVVYYNTDKGVVPSTDIEYASEDEGILYESFSDMNPAFANSIIKNYDGSIPVMKYVNGMREGVILYGMHNFQGVGKDIRRDTYFSDLSEADQKFALELGREYAKMETEKAESNLRSAIKNAAEKAKAEGKTESANGGSVRFDKGVDGAKLNRMQRRTVSLAKYLAKAIGIDIVFYDAITTTDKKGEKANGYFDPKDNSIHLDLQNAMSDSKTIVFTLSHELVHFIKKWSPQKFKTFSDFLMEQYAKHGVSTSALLERKMGELGIEDADVAFEEMIADACERMLLDSNAAVKLMELRKADLDLFEKIKLHIAQLLTKLRDTFRGVDPNTDEGIALQKMEDVLGKIHEMFEDAAVDAAKTYQEAAKVNAAEAVFGSKHVSEGEQDFSVKHQLKDSKKIGDASIAYNDKHNKVNAAVLKVGVDTMIEMAETMMPYLEQEGILPPDIPGKTIFKNGSYGRTGENTTLCVRTLTYEDFKDRVSDALGRPLTVAESLLVSQKIYDIATDPQCIYCYVAADRKAYDEYLGEYHRAMDKYIKAMRNGGDANALYEEYLGGRKDTPAQQKRWAMWKSIANSGKSYISAKDLATRAKRDMIISEKGGFATQVKDAQRYAQNASWAKTVSDYRAYKGDILNLSQTLVDTLNSEYGLRMYSFSDYTPAFIVENMQMIIDAAARGLKSLAYTKDTAYAKIFAPTGQAINVSCFAKYDPETKSYVEDSRQGASWAETKALRDKFRNVGAVMVCTNDEMVAWAMRQDWVDVVIPYHIVKTGTTIANEYAWRNYTAESSDRVGNKTANIYPTEHNNDFAIYQKLVNERGITPRFDRFYQRTLNGEFTKEQYIKLVNEVRLPASELSAVVPMFDLAEAKKSFGVDENGDVIEGGFVDKGGYMGGWYRAGVDVNQEVLAVKKDIEDGKSSLDVDYGMNRQLKEKQSDKYGIKKQAKNKYSYESFGEEFYKESEIYSYDFLTHQKPMDVIALPALSSIFTDGRVDRDLVVKEGKKNALAQDESKSGNNDVVYVKNKYTQKMIEVNNQSIKHSLGGKSTYLLTNSRLGLVIGDVIRNGIPINELNPSEGAESTFAMVAYAVSPENKPFLAIAHIDVRLGTLVQYESREVVHSLRGRMKKGSTVAVNSAPELSDDNLSVNTSTINIAHLLEFVNSVQQSLLSDDVLKHLGEERAADGFYHGEVKHQKKTVTNRTLLANALESVAQNDIERNKLAQYKGKIDLIESEQAKLAEVKARANEIRFTKGRTPEATKEMRSLEIEAKKIENRINTYDRQLLNLESTLALKNVLQREKEKARRDAEAKGRELIHQGVVGRQKTEMRNKIRKVARSLNSLLSHETKKRHVPEGLKNAVEKALGLADILFKGIDIQNEDLVRLGIDDVTVEKDLDAYKALLSEQESLVAELEKIYADENMEEDPLESIRELEGKITGVRNKIRALDKKLETVFVRERAKANKLTVDTVVKLLADAYEDIKESSDEYIKNAYKEEVHQRISALAKSLNGTVARDMDVYQLTEVYDAFKAIEHTVKRANEIFRDGRLESLSDTVQNTNIELRAATTEKKDLGVIFEKFSSFVNGFTWNNLRPVDAFERLGSKTFEKLFWDFVDGMGVAARDIDEAGKVIAEARKKHGYSKWNMNLADKTYKTRDGYEFRPSLADKMSIYAYSKRQQSDGSNPSMKHMVEGGFTYDTGATYKVTENGKTIVRRKMTHTLRLSEADIREVIASLTDEQKAYVDEVQAYLTKMGEKGNEASMVLYGIKLFRDLVYFPLQSSTDYRSVVEQEIGAKQTAASLAGWGATKPTVPNARNPIVLRAFDDVVLEHVEKMSNYHGLVVPIDNLRRVFDNVSQASDTEPQSTKAVIGALYGNEAQRYFQQWLTDINGGMMSSGASNPLMKLFSTAKKTTVAASLSVVAQQYSSIVRAMEVVDPKYFVPLLNREAKKSDMKQYDEMRKYAPIAIIKEMGGFDVGSKGRAKDFIGYEGARKDAKYIAKKIDDISMWGAEQMDKLGWSTIWMAIKAEVAAEQRLSVGSEEFYKACGKRFTEVVTKTQVYDSVASRSGYMRSQRDSVKFATSFMGEATAIAGRYFMAGVELARAIKSKDTARIASAVARVARTASVIAAASVLGNLAKALAYAGRDDDEDEAFLEKWARKFGEALAQDANPVNYVPFGRDIVSIIEGWDVERPDLTLVADLVTSTKKLVDGEVTVEDALGFVGSVGNSTGVPLKNIIREIRAAITFVDDLFVDEVGATNIGGAFKEGVSGKQKSKTDSLYDAILRGDDGRVKAIKGTYKTESAYFTAVRAALRDNDERIAEAAKARIDGNIAKYARIVREIVAEGNFVQDIVVGAVNAEINAINKKADEQEGTIDEEDETEKATSIYRASDINDAFENGDDGLAVQIIDDLVKTKVANGMEEKNAKSSVRSSMTSYWKPLYIAAYKAKDEAEKRRIRKILKESKLYGSTNDVIKTCQEWLRGN